MNTQLFITLLFLSAYCGNCPAQDNKDTHDNDTIMRAPGASSISLPELEAVSPKAAQMERFGNYPANLYTGLVDITIPIYTVKVGGVSVPIEFRYHASGLKYDDIPMELGYGWTLMAGGTARYNARGMGISHQSAPVCEPFIKEVKDIALYGDVKNDKGNNIDPEDQLRLSQVEGGLNRKFSGNYRGYICDSEYDEYVFSVPGIAGSLYRLIKQDGFDADEFSNDNTTNMLHYSGGREPDGPEKINNYPIARDGDGNVYRFGFDDETDYSVSNRTYYLTSISDSKSGEKVCFVYDTSSGKMMQNDTYRPVFTDTYTFTTLDKIGNIDGSHIVSYDFETRGGRSTKYFYVPRLLMIKCRNATVKFIYGSARHHSITEIHICDGTERIIRKIRLIKTDDEYLDAVSFCDANGYETYSYKMEYNGKKPSYSETGIDYWGYCNSEHYTGTNLPVFKMTETGGHIPGHNRSPNENLMKLGILTKITYPTKGYSCFEYEAHRVANYSAFYTSSIYGGLRIRSITNYDSSGTRQECKYYIYGKNQDGLGRAVRPINPNDFYQTTGNVHFDTFGGLRRVWAYTYTFRTYYAFPIFSYFLQGSSVVYPKVSEITKDPQGNTLGKVVYEYTEPDGYNQESQYLQQYLTFRGDRAEFPLHSTEWKAGKLLGRNVYDADGKLVSGISNTYMNHNVKEHLNLRVRRYFNSVADFDLLFDDYKQYTGGTVYDYYNYYTTSGDYVVSSTTETREDGTSVTRQYEYNDKCQVNRITEHLSDGAVRTVNVMHPFDMYVNGDNGTGNIYETMISGNKLSPVIRQTTSVDGVVTDDIYNEYESTTKGPDRMWQNIPYKTKRLEYTYNGKGNISSAVKDGNEAEVCIWGYKGEWPVAVIRGGNAKDALAILGSPAIESILSSYSEYGMSQIESLRNNSQMRGCQITTYYYDVRYGLTKQINPSGMKMSYHYDSFGRLTAITNDEGYVLEKYEYDYKND